MGGRRGRPRPRQDLPGGARPRPTSACATPPPPAGASSTPLPSWASPGRARRPRPWPARSSSARAAVTGPPDRRRPGRLRRRPGRRGRDVRRRRHRGLGVRAHPARRRRPRPRASRRSRCPDERPRRRESDVGSRMLLSIPSPSQGVWYLGPVPIRAYALAIILGVVAAVWVGDKRWVARGGRGRGRRHRPLGGAGGDHRCADLPRGHRQRALLRQDGRPVDGAGDLERRPRHLGRDHGRAVRRLALLAAPRASCCAPLADALAPGLLLAQAIGRFGNYFNQELFGKPTDLPWALEIDAAHRPRGYAGRRRPSTRRSSTRRCGTSPAIALLRLAGPAVPARATAGSSRST